MKKQAENYGPERRGTGMIGRNTLSAKSGITSAGAKHRRKLF